MNSTRIKSKLESFFTEYQEKLGTFGGNLVIYNFIEFIKTNPAVKPIMKNQFIYSESQKEKIMDMTDDELSARADGNGLFDIENPETWPNKDIFAKEHDIASAIIKDSQPFNSVELYLPLALAYLSAIHWALSEAKERIDVDPEKSKEITDVVKELATISLPFKYKEKNEEKSLSFAAPKACIYFMAIIISYIISELDSKEFLKGSESTPPITFDKDESLLTINGTKIKISRTNDLSADHYILEAIWDSEDISDEVYFRDVAKKMDEFADYDKEKDGRKFYRACQRLNQKIQTDTEDRVIKFLEFHSTWCKINQKYLKS